MPPRATSTTAPPQAALPAPAAATPGEVPASGAQAAVPTAAATPEAVRAAPGGERVRIRTDLILAEFDPVGATLVRLELPRQKPAPDWTERGLARLLGLTDFLHSQGFGQPGRTRSADSDVVLLDTSAERVYQAQTGLIGGPTDTTFPNHRTTHFDLLPGPRTLEPGQESLMVRLQGEAGGVRLTKTFVFRRGHYDIQVTHEVANVGSATVAPSLYLQLVRDGGKAENDASFARTYTGAAFYSETEKYRKVSFEDIDKHKAEDFKPAGDGWVAMVQHYFVSAWVPAAGAVREFYDSVRNNPFPENPKLDKLYSVGLLLKVGTLAPGAQASLVDTLYVGPQDQKALEKIAAGLDRVTDYGWLDPIAKPIFWLLSAIHGLVSNWGWAIVLLTVLIKAAFYPLSAASFKSMAKMKELQPRLTKLREQYGEDRQKLQLAMMEMYKQEKINPVMGCLPMLVQIPVFIALYWVLLASVEIRSAPWMLWINDLAAPDPWFVLPVVMMVSMWIQYRLNPKPPDPTQAKVMAVMPFIFGAMFFFFPAGLVLYWIVNNVLSILQQWRITHVVARARAVG